VDDDTKKILYVQTHGVDMPERSATPFYLAAAGAAMDAEVSIYFTMNGPTLLQKGVPEKLIVPKKGAAGENWLTLSSRPKTSALNYMSASPRSTYTR